MKISLVPPYKITNYKGGPRQIFISKIVHNFEFYVIGFDMSKVYIFRILIVLMKKRNKSFTHKKLSHKSAKIE